MAKVQLKKVKGKNPTTKEVIYYPQVAANGKMSGDDFVENVCKETKMPENYVEGAYKYLGKGFMDFSQAA